MKKLVVFLLGILAISCKKDADGDPFRDIWIEQSMRLDTVEFNPLYSSSTQSLYLRSQPPVMNKGYHYQVKTDSILLQWFGSSGSSATYYFNFNGTKKFTISNFFMRPGLPSIVQFEKLK